MTATEAPASKLDRVRKLLAMAEGEAALGNEEAAGNYTNTAAALMARYGIDAARLAATDPGSDTIGTLEIYCEAPFPTRKRILLCCVANPMRVSPIVYPRAGNRQRVVLHGYESDLARVNTLYTSVLLQVSRLLPWVQVRPSHKSADRQSWIIGYAVAVRERLEVLEADTAEHAPPAGETSMALVLVGRKARVDAEVARRYPKLGKVKRATYSGQARAQGYAEGQRADLGSRTGQVQAQGQRALSQPAR